MRLFFALAPGASSAAALGAWRDRQVHAEGRSVPLPNLHITLAFLGEISQNRLESLCNAVDTLAPGDGPLHLHLDQLGYWPKPGICWIGPSQWPERLETLARRLDEIGVAQGGKRSRGRYQPHITLLRGCQTPPPAPIEAPTFDLEFDHFSLFESRQGRRGVSYAETASWPL